MENNMKLYIVSFGNSRKYRFPFSEIPSPDGLHHSDSNPISTIEKELNDSLWKMFPEANLAYFTSPKVTEVEWAHRDRYADYPILDSDAVEEIKKVLATEIRDMRSTDVLDSDAPYSNIPGGVKG